MARPVTRYRIPVIQGAVVRALSGLCALLWVVGSVSAAYGSLTPQWTMPHCPQGHSHHTQHSQDHCIWHCDGIDAHGLTGKSAGAPVAPAGFLASAPMLHPQASTIRDAVAPRGPPSAHFA